MITCNFSLSGIKELKVGYQTGSGQPLNFPIYPTYNLSNGYVICSETSTGTTIGGVTVATIDLNPDFSSFTEELTIDDTGRYFTRTFSLNSIYDDNLVELLDNKFIIVFLTDYNNRKWVIGYDNPMKLMTYSLNSGIQNDGQDSYNLIYTSKSYNTIKQTTNPTTPNPTATLVLVNQNDGNPTDPYTFITYRVNLSTPTSGNLTFQVRYSNTNNSYYILDTVTIPNNSSYYQWTATYQKQGVSWNSFAMIDTQPGTYTWSNTQLIIPIPTSYS